MGRSRRDDQSRAAMAITNVGAEWSAETIVIFLVNAEKEFSESDCQP
jgi:hypothetical protein